MREAGGKREQNEFTKQSNWNWNTCTKAARPAHLHLQLEYIQEGAWHEGGVSLFAVLLAFFGC